MKYLGITLDQHLRYGGDVEHVIAKAEKYITALTRLMPRMDGPSTSKRRILAGVVDSVVAYGADVWARIPLQQKYVKKLESLYRKINMRLINAYRTTSKEDCAVLAGKIPVDIFLKLRSGSITKTEARELWQTG